MSHRPSLQDFVDDELLRAALTMDQVVDAVIEQWRRFTPAAARMSTDPVRLLTQHRSDLVRDAVRELRARAAAEMGGPTVNRSASATAAPAKLELALIGEIGGPNHPSLSAPLSGVLTPRATSPTATTRCGR